MNGRSFNIDMKKTSQDPEKPVTGRQKTTAERRQKILEAAITCFLENGYHQTGVRDIAKRAGVSLGNLYNHFPGKHDVLVEIAALERAELAPILKILRGPATAPDVLDKFLNAYTKYLSSLETVILTIEISSEAIRKPDIGELFLDNRNDLSETLASVIERGMDDGDFRQNLDTTEVAHLILELLEGCAYRSVLSEIPMRKILGNVKDFVFAAVISP
ncbi:MAG: TetR/AcrR family transcriptional regulator [Pseudomonadota bacterium]